MVFFEVEGNVEARPMMPTSSGIRKNKLPGTGTRLRLRVKSLLFVWYDMLCNTHTEGVSSSSLWYSYPVCHTCTRDMRKTYLNTYVRLSSRDCAHNCPNAHCRFNITSEWNRPELKNACTPARPILEQYYSGVSKNILVLLPVPVYYRKLRSLSTEECTFSVIQKAYSPIFFVWPTENLQNEHSNSNPRIQCNIVIGTSCHQELECHESRSFREIFCAKIRILRKNSCNVSTNSKKLRSNCEPISRFWICGG